MKFRRFFRDAGVLFAFCGAFYLLITFVNRLDGETEIEGTDFSIAREQADQFSKQQKWDSAAEEYRLLTIQDPYNGYAWERYASSFYTMRFTALKELESLESSGESDKAKLDAVRQRIKLNGDQAYKIFSKVREFARFRGGALLRMAVIDTQRENETRALELLQEFVDNGHNTQFGLDEYTQFGRGGDSMPSLLAVRPEGCRLHSNPKFWAIVRKEKQNRSRF